MACCTLKKKRRCSISFWLCLCSPRIPNNQSHSQCSRAAFLGGILRTTHNMRPLAPGRLPTRCLLHQSHPLASENAPTQTKGDRRNLPRLRVAGTSTRSNQRIISISEKGPTDIIPDIPQRIAQISRAGLQTTRPGQHLEIRQDAIIVGIWPRASATTTRRWDTTT